MITVGAAFLEQAIDNLAHAPGDDGDGRVGLFAAGNMALVKAPKVRAATHGDPGAFDQCPAQPFVAGP